MFTANLSLLGHNTDVHFRVPRDKHKKICQHLGGKPLKFAGLPNHVRVSINYGSMDQAMNHDVIAPSLSRRSTLFIGSIHWVSQKKSEPALMIMYTS